MVAFGTLHPKKAVLKSAAIQVLDKFQLYVQWQGLALHSHHIPELGVEL